MKVIKSIAEIAESNICVTIGNFDGVHLGHQDFLSYVKGESVNNGQKFLVITFVPHPAFVLRAQPHFLLNTYVERRNLLEKLDVDYLLELDFTRDFSTLKPEEFLEKFVFFSGKVKSIYLGYDFHFGANKTGNFEIAKKYAFEKNINLILHSEFKLKNSSVSSSVIRKNIHEGNLEVAASMLGRNFFMSGRVIKGEGRGRKIGFPTANLGYGQNSILPSNGVYISKAHIGNLTYESVTNVGQNPTFNTGYEIHIETHILGFTRDIYGEEISVEFIKKLRDEKKFSSVNELVSQIDSDVNNTKKYFNHD